MNEKLVLRGIVSSGLGQGGFFTLLDWVKQQCQDKLGFIPFPGTLNLRVDQEYLQVIERLRVEEGVNLIPPTADFCQAKSFPIAIEDIEAAIIVPDAEHFTEDIHSGDVIEVIAPVNIKEALCIKDGDQLTIKIK